MEETKQLIMPNVAECRKIWSEYITDIGGYYELTEFDHTPNKISRSLIRAVKRERGQAWLGKINVWGSFTAKMWEYKRGMVYNFSADYVIPFYDAELETMIEQFNAATERMVVGELLYKILATIDRDGGYYLNWT